MTFPPPKRAVIFITIADNDIINDMNWDGCYCSLVMDLDSGDYLFAAAEDADLDAAAWCRHNGYTVVPVDDVYEYIPGNGWTEKETP